MDDKLFRAAEVAQADQLIAEFEADIAQRAEILFPAISIGDRTKMIAEMGRHFADWDHYTLAVWAAILFYERIKAVSD